MSEAKTRETRLMFAAAFVLGVAARFLLPRLGFDFDAVSFRIVADTNADSGKRHSSGLIACNVLAASEGLAYHAKQGAPVGLLVGAASAEHSPLAASSVTRPPARTIAFNCVIVFLSSYFSLY